MKTPKDDRGGDALTDAAGPGWSVHEEPGLQLRFLSPRSLANTELYSFRFAGMGPPGSFRLRPAYGIGLIEHSQTEVSYRGDRFCCSDGAVAVSRPFEAPRVVKRHSARSSIGLILLDPAMVEESIAARAPRWRREDAPGYVIAPTQPLRHAVETLFRTLEEPQASLLQQTAAWHCSEHLAMLYSNSSAETRASPPHVQRAREYLHANYTKDVTLNELASAVGGLNPRYLLSLFSRELNLPPHRYLLHLRLNRARELLATGMSAALVAREVGFCDGSQLHRHFVRIVGLTPGAYAKAVR